MILISSRRSDLSKGPSPQVLLKKISTLILYGTSVLWYQNSLIGGADDCKRYRYGILI